MLTYLIIMFFLFLIIALIAALILLLSIISGAPWAPTKRELVKKMIVLANIKNGEKAIDLGSGDGRIVIELAKAGAEAHGYEINPFLVWLSRQRIKKANLSNKAFIHFGDFWKENFSNYNVVTLFGIGYIMSALEKKLQKELPPGSRIVSNAFTFPKWQYSQKESGLYLYKKTPI